MSTRPDLLGPNLSRELGDDARPDTEPAPVRTGWAWILLAVLTALTLTLQLTGA
jgi:hypothetical protein